MRWLLIGTAYLALAACHKTPESYASDENRAVMADVAAPDIPVTAAPGVAFNYHYAFRLPAEQIAATQEEHASACEKLGIARCRIAGMRFQLLGEHDVRATLAFNLEPSIARAFGRAGIASVQAAKGTLVEADITSTDAGSDIEQARLARARAATETQRLDARIAASRSAGERSQLESQRADAQRSVSSADDTVSAAQQSLADTPMVFEYESGPAVRGFDASAPFTSAANAGLSSLQTTLAFVLGFLAIFGPPALVVLAVWLVWRRFRPAGRLKPVAEG